MNLIDWIKSKVYKNYVPLAEYEALGKISDERQTKERELQRRISELEKENRNLRSYSKESFSKPIQFETIGAKTMMSEHEVALRRPTDVRQIVNENLAYNLAKEISKNLAVTENIDKATGNRLYYTRLTLASRALEGDY